MIRVLVKGATGRMGSRILALIQNGKEFQAVEEIGSADVLIDFTHPKATLDHLEMAARAHKAAVIGTTGHTPEQRQAIDRLASKLPFVFSPNMSVGVNVLFKIIAEAARPLSEGFDLEIVETHHRGKKDAPSGTAMRIGEILAQTLGRDLSHEVVYHREGTVGGRKKGEIGIQSLRGGDVVGEHSVLFLGDGERLEITHRATSRDIFAHGALRAARWIVGKPNGLYSMANVLALS